MAATRRERIIYTTVSAVLIIVISSFYRYQPNVVENRIQQDWNKREKMDVKVVNKNEGWIALNCDAYYDKNFTTEPWWTSNATLFPSKQQGIITLPEIMETDIVDVICKFRAGNGCQAEGFTLFENPGNDIYYCARSVSGCSVVFQPDGSVNKLYEERETAFLGYVPTPENQQKCSWIDCLIDPEARIIGKKACCGPKCTLW